MKVLYVLKRYPRASETFIVREILGVEAAGIEVSIDSLLPAELGVRHPEVDNVRAEVRTLPRHPRMVEWRVFAAHLAVFTRTPHVWLREALLARTTAKKLSSADPWRRFVQAGLVATRIRREHVDHVHAHFATAAADVAVPAAKLAGVSVSITAHAKDIFQKDNADRLVDRLGRADRIVTVSDFNVAHLRTCLPTATIVQVPNGVALGEPHGPTAAGPLLCVARLVEKKGIDTLLEALAEVFQLRVDLRLEILGDGPLLGDLTNLSSRLGIADRVLFRGMQPSSEVTNAYQRCSMVVLPCRVTADGDRDGLPTILVEAMARAVPVISTAVVGIPELIRDGETGLLVPPNDAGALGAAIEKLLDDPDAAKQLGMAGREHVATNYDPETSTHRLIATWSGIS